MAPEPKELRGESIAWYDFKESIPNSHEKLFFALLVVQDRSSVAELNEWVGKVLRYEAPYISKGNAGLPSDWVPSAKNVYPDVFKLLRRAYADQVYDDARLQKVADAMHCWAGDGKVLNLTPQKLKDHRARQHKYKRDHSKAMIHWKSLDALFGVARFIKDHRREMGRLLGEECTAAKPTMMELDVMYRALSNDLHEAEAAVAREKDAKRHAIKRLATLREERKKEQDASKAKAKADAVKLKKEIKEAKDAAKAKYLTRKDEVRKQLMPHLKEVARNVVDGEIQRSNRLRNDAHAAKRTALQQLNEVEELSGKRLCRAQTAEGKLTDAQISLDEYHEHYAAALTAKRTYEQIGKRVDSMPTWTPTRATGKRGGGKQWPNVYRRAAYGMHSNGTPLSAIGKNISMVVRLTAPWLTPEEPSQHFLIQTRFELRMVEECLAGRQLGSAFAVRMLGFDESTKYGNAAITSNAIVEETEGGPLKVVVLRGVYCSAGGTAEAISSAVNKKCFARLRDHVRRWKEKFLKKHPDEPWTGPNPEQICLGRLAGGGAIMSDTCNTAQKVQDLLEEKIAAEFEEIVGREKWEAMSEAERKHETRVHKLQCWQHMRNIFLKHMSAAQAKHVANELKPWLDAFTSWERMSTDFDSLLRAAYKEFHQGNAYYKGKGREFWAWLRTNHPKIFAMRFERAEGGRQDLDYDAALPLYAMRPHMIEFLHSLVFGADHSNILEDFLYVSLSSLEYIAMVRANAIIDILISRPLRWLAGNAYQLDNFSPLDLRVCLRIVHDLFERVAADGSLLLTFFDVFEPITRTQPLFAEWRRSMYEEQHVYSPDGSVSHLHFALLRDELFNPKDPTNQRSRIKTIEYLEVQAAAGLEKITDKKLALARNVAGPDGVEDVLARADTIGLDATNDRLAESLFGHWDHVLRRCGPTISLEAASALVQSMRMRSFDKGGAFDVLPPKEADVLMELARETVDEMREIDRADHRELNEYHAAKRKSNSQLELDALVKQYALALSFFDRWQKRGVASMTAAKAKVKQLDTNQEKLDYLREEIEMRTIGLGFDHIKTAWSSSKDETVGTVDDLQEVLQQLLAEERVRRGDGTLPTVAAVPQMRRKTFKELGTPTAQAELLAQAATPLSVDEEQLLHRAHEERQRLVIAGELDEVADLQDEDAPACNDSLVGAKLEIRWRYWEPVNDPTGKDKRKKKAVDIWCECEAVEIANSTTTESATCKKLVGAGAVRVKWPADRDREVPEDESYTWCILTKENWNKEVKLGWRFTATELEKRQAAAQPSKRRRTRED